MTELEYPFDASHIIQKRRSIRRTLLADVTPSIQKRIALLGCSTTIEIV